MLYLNNIVLSLPSPINLDLTLTNVVFEYVTETEEGIKPLYLTLTNVVFEFSTVTIICKKIKFNFNKCCIWIV